MKKTQFEIYVYVVEVICKTYTEETGVAMDDIPYDDFFQICACARYYTMMIDTLFGFLAYNSLIFKNSNNEKV